MPVTRTFEVFTSDLALELLNARSASVSSQHTATAPTQVFTLSIQDLPSFFPPPLLMALSRSQVEPVSFASKVHLTLDPLALSPPIVSSVWGAAVFCLNDQTCILTGLPTCTLPYNRFARGGQRGLSHV